MYKPQGNLRGGEFNWKRQMCYNISTNAPGAIFTWGVVGPVRTGKSTFIKRFMELLVLPNIEEFHEREIAQDNCPQSGGGRMVIQRAKFIPSKAVEINVREGIDMRVRMVDCVGYSVPGLWVFREDEEPRMVHSPGMIWKYLLKKQRNWNKKSDLRPLHHRNFGHY